MYTFFLHKDAAEQIWLQDEQGQRLSPMHLLTIYPDAKVFTFEGQLGAGKTTFIRYLCEQMGTQDVVNSPTFAIVNVYEVGKEEVYHFDCYRLKSLAEAYDLGAEEYIYSGNYCFIEWPQLLSPILPDDTVQIHIDVLEDGSRRLTCQTINE